MRRHYTAFFALACLVATLHQAHAQTPVQGQWTPTGAMKSPREESAQVHTGNGNVLVIGGTDGSGAVLNSAEIYNATTGVWALTSPLKTPREAFTAVVLKNGIVLAAGGLSTGGTVLTAAELYNPKTATWSDAGSLMVARYAHTATVLANGKVLVTGGCAVNGCGTLTGASEIYDPATNAWSLTGSLGTPRSFHSAVLLHGGNVLAIDGYAPAATATCEIYNPATKKWTPAASTNAARAFHSTTLLPDGKVLVSGGVVVKYPMNSAELYNPALNSWTPTASMATGRYAHSSTLLSDGTVLVAGGEGQSISCGKACTGYIPTAKAEIYSETTNAFTPAASLPRALAYQATTALTNGRALINGGEGYTATCCVVVSDSSFYTPLTFSFSAASVDFGFLQLGLTSATQTVTVTNASVHAATIANIAASGNFAQTNTCPAMLQPGAACTISITFTPTAAGLRAGAVTLTDNDPGSPKQVIALTGTGEALALAFSPGSLALGSVAVGSSAAQSATLINDSAAPVTLGVIGISPKNPTFTQTNNCPATLAVQQSCTLQVTFTPPDVVTYKATLSVANTAGAAPVLPLAGTGLDGGGG